MLRQGNLGDPGIYAFWRASHFPKAPPAAIWKLGLDRPGPCDFLLFYGTFRGDGRSQPRFQMGPEAAWNRVGSYPELYDPTVMTERSHQNGVDPRISGFQDSLENSREPFSIQFSSVVHINFRTVGKFRTAGARCVVMESGVSGVSRGSRHSRHPS